MDFVQLVLTSPNENGICDDTDFLEVSTPSGYIAPRLCGKNTDQHIYIDIGPVPTDNTVVTFTLTGIQQNRYWEILVSQYSCGSRLAPHSGCLQYFTGVSGRIESYNYQNPDAPFLLGKMDYSACIRQEKGYCSITYTALDFKMDKVNTCTKNNSLCRGQFSCLLDYVIIPRGSATGLEPTFDRWCGSALTDGFAPNYARSLPITTTSLPFTLGVHTTIHITRTHGFNIQYKQNTC